MSRSILESQSLIRYRWIASTKAGMTGATGRWIARGWHNFEAVYHGLADAWAVYDNQGHKPVFIDGSHG